MNFKAFFKGSALFAAASVLAHAHASGFVPSVRPASPVKVPLKVVRGPNMAYADCTVDGVKCTMLVDTGATHTTFTEAFFKKNFPDAKLEKVMLAGTTNVSGSPSLATIVKLEVGEAAFGDFDAMVYPLGGAGGFMEGVDGILGMNILGSTRTLLSISRGEAVFAAGGALLGGFEYAELDAADPFTLRLQTKRSRMIIDSGATFTFMDAKTRWPTTGEKVEMPAMAVDGTKTLAPEKGRPGLLRLKGGAALKIIPLVMENAPDCIGSDTLARYDLLIDWPKAGFKEVAEKKDNL